MKYLASIVSGKLTAVRPGRAHRGLGAWHWFVVGLLAASLMPLDDGLSAHPIGWLEVLQARGQVVLTQSPPQLAQIGDRLSKIGDSLETGPNSFAMLGLDEDMGTINVAENTSLRVSRLGRLRSGARVTKLDLDRGQVRLQVRRFHNVESRLDIHSPAGVAAVRGTEYGISLSEDNRMIVATESGLVTAAALGQTVYLEPDFGSRLRPGEPPSPPLRLDRELKLKLHSTEINTRQMYVSGEIHPLNSVSVAGVEVPVDDQGQFAVTVPLSGSLFSLDVEIVVSNALGESQRYSPVGLPIRSPVGLQ